MKIGGIILEVLTNAHTKTLSKEMKTGADFSWFCAFPEGNSHLGAPGGVPYILIYLFLNYLIKAQHSVDLHIKRKHSDSILKFIAPPWNPDHSYRHRPPLLPPLALLVKCSPTYLRQLISYNNYRGCQYAHLHRFVFFLRFSGTNISQVKLLWSSSLAPCMYTLSW